jgi:hypothetical protein
MSDIIKESDRRPLFFRSRLAIEVLMYVSRKVAERPTHRKFQHVADQVGVNSINIKAPSSQILLNGVAKKAPFSYKLPNSLVPSLT